MKAASSILRHAYELTRAVREGDVGLQAILAGQILENARGVVGIEGTAEQKLLKYLKANPRKLVPGAILEAVAGGSDYARALRSLRAKGWKIATAGTKLSKHERESLKSAGVTSIPNGEYVLTSRYHRWSV